MSSLTLMLIGMGVFSLLLIGLVLSALEFKKDGRQRSGAEGGSA